SRDWRAADRLSIGTAEQIYLLLRVALAARLTLPGRVCPILLDDVTVQADEVRTKALLDLLLQISSERQVVLFAASPIVDGWAAQNLTGGSHSVIALPAPGAA
ncbi:MAG: chromosome segregation protein SMC, partial [Actinomycetes bacterium]